MSISYSSTLMKISALFMSKWTFSTHLISQYRQGKYNDYFSGIFFGKLIYFQAPITCSTRPRKSTSALSMKILDFLLLSKDALRLQKFLDQLFHQVKKTGNYIYKLFKEYVIIDDYCPIDPTTTIITSGTEPQAKFEFEAFQFKGLTEPIEIFCEISICEAANCKICDATASTAITTTTTAIPSNNSTGTTTTVGQISSQFGTRLLNKLR